MKCIFYCASLFLLASGSVFAQKSRMNVFLQQNELMFNVSYNDRPVIENSSLGIIMDNCPYGKNIKSFSETESSDESIRSYLANGVHHSFYVDVREFDDGIAFRYRIPANGPKCVYGESTSFVFPSNTTEWYASGPFQYGWHQIYQERKTDSIEGELLAPPATFLTQEGIYAAITEANLFNFHGAVMYCTAPNKIQFGYADNKGHIETGIETGLPPAKYWHEAVRNNPWIAYPDKNEIKTPWRVLMLADDLNGLVNNKIISQVCDKPDNALFSDSNEWIKPGRAVFTWLTEGGVERLSVANHKKYIDGCAELGIESVVVDDGWENWAQTEKEANGRDKWAMLKELVEYADSKNVNIWVWRPSSPRYGNRSDIGLVDPEERASFMAKCAEIGVKGLKIDFFHTENLFTVRLMEEILKDAAKEKLMVIFHGVNKPAGESFKYPNLLAKEAVRGLECVGGESSWAPGPAWPFHNTVLPFTRWLAGPADYTPLNFRAFCPEAVTFTHQLASIYMFTSPMLILAADMEDMLKCPGRRFIEEVPVVWDENYVLPESKIGNLAAIARRKGDIWYLSVLNGEQEKSVSLNLNFLPEGKYKMVIAYDKGRKEILMDTKTIKSKKSLNIKLLSGGGYLARFERI